MQEKIKKELLKFILKNFGDKISEKFIIKYKKYFEYMNWKILIENKKLSEDFIREFKDFVNWDYVCMYQKLSEDFIREFKDFVNWYHISLYQKLSEGFIREFKDIISFKKIFRSQRLSEDFIREFKYKFDENKNLWEFISSRQKLSDDFIKENIYELSIYSLIFNQNLSEDILNEIINISRNYLNHIISFQQLSENFIRKYKDFFIKNDWKIISKYQKFSKEFVKEFSSLKLIDKKIYNKVNKEKSKKQKLEEIYDFSKKYNLEFDGRFLYAYRYHDIFGRGLFKQAVFYDKGNYYQDFHCNMIEEDVYSFGFGIFSKRQKKIEENQNNNLNKKLVSVKVSIDDWGCEVFKVIDLKFLPFTIKLRTGKARVKGFTYLEDIED